MLFQKHSNLSHRSLKSACPGERILLGIFQRIPIGYPNHLLFFTSFSWHSFLILYVLLMPPHHFISPQTPLLIIQWNGSTSDNARSVRTSQSPRKMTLFSLASELYLRPLTLLSLPILSSPPFGKCALSMFSLPPFICFCLVQTLETSFSVSFILSPSSFQMGSFTEAYTLDFAFSLTTVFPQWYSFLELQLQEVGGFQIKSHSPGLSPKLWWTAPLPPGHSHLDISMLLPTKHEFRIFLSLQSTFFLDFSVPAHGIMQEKCHFAILQILGHFSHSAT